MSGVFSDIPVRSNSDTNLVDASWWNTIRSALMNAFGGATIATLQTIADNQSSAANVTGLSIDHTIYQCATVEYTIIRSDGTNKRREQGRLFLSYDSQNGWILERESRNADALNLANSLTVTSAGQVQYISDSMGGTYAGKMTWKISNTFEQEGI